MRLRRMCALLCAAAIVLVLTATSIVRNAMWINAVTLGEDVVRKSPFKTRAYNDLGFYYFRRGMLDEALVRFQTAVMINPRYANGYCNMAAVYLKKNDASAALPYLRRALAIDPRHDKANFNMGLIYAAEGELPRARRYFGASCAGGYEPACAALQGRMPETDAGNREAASPAP